MTPEHWLTDPLNTEIPPLILQNDIQFKTHLDHYKYADRFPEQSPFVYRQQGEIFLKQLELKLTDQSFLNANTATLTDIAIFPFIRQFAYVDIKWFETSPYPKLRNWLNNWLKSELFQSIMQKLPYWQPEQDEIKNINFL